MPLRFLAGPIAVLGAVLMGGACGSSEPPVEDRLTACEVVTTREVESAIRRPVSPPTASDAATDQLAGRSGCAWSSEDGGVGVLIELVRTQDMSRSVRRTGFSAAARYQAALAEHPDARLPDGSLFVEEESKLWLLVGDSLAVLEVAATPTAEVRRIATALAARAAPRLERADF